MSATTPDTGEDSAAGLTDFHETWSTLTTAELPGVSTEALAGLLSAEGGAIVTRPGVARWEVDLLRWQSVRRAISRAADADRPAAPIGRVPAWLESLVRDKVEELARTWSHRPDEWLVARILERHGLVCVPHDDTYTLAFVGTMGGGDPVRAIRSDPDALEVFWRCFEVEGGGEVSLANLDKYTDGAWSSAVLTLVRDGDLDRDQLLTAILD